MLAAYLFLYKKQKPQITIESVFVVLLFIFQSLSIFQAINISSYFSRYKELIVGILGFYVGYVYRNKITSILKVIFISTLISILFQIFFIITPYYALNIFKVLIYDKLFNLMELNNGRQRTYFETFDETTIPLLIIAIIKTKKLKNKIIFCITTFLIAITTIYSGWRTRLLMLLAATYSSLLVMKKYHLLLSIMAVSVILFGFVLSSNTTITRVNFDEENISSIESRVSQLSETISILQKAPFGVGLGNYYDNIKKSTSQFTSSLNKNQQNLGILADENVHNIFGMIGVEAGIPAFLVFCVLLMIFIINDYKIILDKDYHKIAIAFAFWTVFIYSLLNPLIPGSVNFLFWFLRGLLIV